MKKIISIITATILMSSCVDTVLLPDDKTVHEDFWKTKGDVELMVNGAYKSMLNEALMLRLFVWGDFRSDELVYNESVINGGVTEDIEEINTANVETTNTFADWASLYSVINNCNIVLENAEQVIKIDPSYTEGEYKAHCSQMLALRALCYFYLVRNFRDVPYTDKPYMNSSQDMNIGQSAPAFVLERCITDLEEARKDALNPTGFLGWKRKGWINKDGVNSILADIYLWRAAMKEASSDSIGAAADYLKVMEYCDLVIQSKKDQYVPGVFDTEIPEYPLAEGMNAFNDVFVFQNSDESIFELQADGNTNSNTGMCQAICSWKSGQKDGYFSASTLFATAASGQLFEKTSDYRRLNSIYLSSKSEATSYKVRKYVEQTSYIISNPTTVTVSPGDGIRTYNTYAQNYIFYRLSDIMLMKAEAMTSLATNTADTLLRQAFNLVQYINSRSLYESNLATDSIRWRAYNNPTLMETLVLNERLRELCFEGKRWYDLMRYNYRNVTGVDYTKTLAQISEEGGEFVTNHDAMMTLFTRKLGSQSFVVKSKMPTEPYLYMPVLQSQIEVNPNLKQNPVYSSGDVFEKNY